MLSLQLAFGGLLTLIGLVVGWVVWRTGELRSLRIPVLIYHRIVPRGQPLREEDRGERGCIVYDDEFRDHLRALNAAGYRTISPAEFLAHHRKQSELTGRPVLITFDDGWRSVHEFALPALREAGMTATVFMNTERRNPNFLAGEPVDGPLSDQMIIDLDAAGITIGSHGASHVFLTTCSPEELRSELVDSKAMLEALLRKPVVTLAVPGGQSNAAVRREAARAGYELLFGGGSGTLGRNSDLWSLRRLGVERDTSGDRLVRNLTPGSVLAHRFVREFKLLPTRLLGPRRSNRLRHWLIAHGFGWMLRMRVLKAAVLGLVVAIVVSVVVAGVWARFIEPDLIRIDDLEVDLPGLAPGLETLRVAFIADLHIEQEGRREARLVRELNALDLDLLLVGGDFVQNAYWMSDYLDYVDAACRVIRSVRVRHGTYAVFGNNDEPEAMATRFDEAGIRMLDNRWERLELPGGALTLLGVGDPVTGLTDWDEAFRVAPPVPILAIAHSPDAFAEAARRGLPWLLTGHTHGGQVLHPFIRLDPERFLRLLPGTPPYRAGLYREGPSALYVNRGIGMTHIPLRLACSPEITRIHLRSR